MSSISTPEHLPRNLQDIPSIKVLSPTNTGTSIESPGTIASPPKTTLELFVDQLKSTYSNMDTNTTSSSNIGNTSPIDTSEISPSQLDAINRISNAMVTADQEVLARTTTDTIQETIQSVHNSVAGSSHHSTSSSSSSSVHNSVAGSVHNSASNSPDVINTELPHNSVVNSPANSTTQLTVEGASNLTPPQGDGQLPTPDNTPIKPQSLNPSASPFKPRPSFNVETKKLPLFSEFGMYGWKEFSEISNQNQITMTDSDGTVKTIVKNTIRKSFS